MSLQNCCSMCPYFCHSKDKLYAHLLRRHKFEPNFIVHCSKAGCGASFKTVAGLRTHHYRKHANDPEAENSEDDILVQENEDHNDVETETEDFMKKWEAQFILMLVAQHNLSQKAVDDILVSMKQMNVFRNNLMKENIRSQVPEDIYARIDLDKIFSDDMFEGLQSKYLREKYFERYLGYIKPAAVKLGEKRVNVKLQNKYRFIEKDVLGYYVPFFCQLQEILKMPEVQEELHAPKKSDFQFADIRDGTHFQNPFLRDHADALLFCLYHDDFEIVNPIGSHRKKHKLSVFYWTLLNIGPENRFKLQATQLLAIGKSKDLRKFGISNLLQDFVDSLNVLHEGKHFLIGEERKKYYGMLYCALGDTPAAQLLGGFKEGVGMAEKPCRSCEVRYDNLASSFSEDDFISRDEAELRDRCDVLDQIKGKTRKYWSKQYGITGRSTLLQVPEFEVTKCILHDPMHVLLEGIVKLEIQLMLETFIEKMKYFSLSYLNTAIKTFNYTEEKSTDKPQEIEMKSLRRPNTFPMTAIETKTFMELLPFMIGEKIQPDDEHWKNFIRLLKITLLVISPIASDETIASLKQLIHDHNSNFSKLYPDIQFTPKLHYLCHFPNQILQFGPGRNHWCVRMEAKHSLFKNKKWKNFKSLPLSVASYHQQWMCLRQLSVQNGKSEVYLYSGDSVSVGSSLKFADLCDGMKDTIRRNETHITDTLLQTSCVKLKGITYRIGNVLLKNYDEDELDFCVINDIYVSNNIKYFQCKLLDIIEYCPVFNAFACRLTEETFCLPALNIKYRWPLINHTVGGQMYVMLFNVDFCWC